jgi:hypothetical protein
VVALESGENLSFGIAVGALGRGAQRFFWHRLECAFGASLVEVLASALLGGERD